MSKDNLTQSFCRSVKAELERAPLDSGCCVIAELAALIRTAGNFDVSQKNFPVEIRSESESVIRRAESLISRSFGGADISADSLSLKINSAFSLRLLEDIGIIERGEGCKPIITEHTSDYILTGECCLKAYVRGAFLGAGYAYIPNEEGRSRGYHLEFVFDSEVAAADLGHLLAQLEIFAKKVLRNSKFVVYLKNSEAISRLLTHIGAPVSALRVYSEIAARSVRNTATRRANCDSANIDKTVEAALKQMEAIDYLFDTGEIDELPEHLQQTALLRLANPEASVSELAALSGGMSRGGLAHRLAKIMRFYKSAKGDN